MKVAIIHYAEPVSLDEGFVITRYASLAKCLLKDEIKVTRYFPSFNHRSRKFRKFRSYKDKEYGNHIKIDTPDYYRSRSIKRLIFLRAFKRNLFIKLSKTKYDLYLVGCPMPGIASEIKKRFPQSKVLLDLRDFWPDIYHARASLLVGSMESLSSLTSSGFSSGSASPSTAGFFSSGLSGSSTPALESSEEVLASSSASNPVDIPQQITVISATTECADNLAEAIREITDDGNWNGFMIRLSEVRLGNYDSNHCNKCIIGMQAESVEFGSC